MFPEILKRLERIEILLATLIGQGKIIMASITDLQNAVAQETTLENSIEALVTGLQTQLAAALANQTVPPDVQAAIDSTFATVQSNIAGLTASVAANTPAAPPVTSTASVGS